jgi:hypothetical protein
MPGQWWDKIIITINNFGKELSDENKMITVERALLSSNTVYRGPHTHVL